MTASGSRTLSTNGQVLDGVDLTGTVTVNADNVTIQNSKLHLANGGSGTAVIKLSNGADNFTIKDSEVYGGSSSRDAIESAVWNIPNNDGATAIRTYFHGCSECWHGSGTFRDAYIVVDAGYPGSHDEDIYLCDGMVDIDHSTLFNYHDQTSTFFGDTYCGGSNDITITDSLLAGGGQMLTMQAHSTSRVGTMTVTGNHFARCLGAPYTANNGHWYCTGGSDEHGLWPYGGSYMLATEYYTGTGQTWENNVWDDNLQPVCPNGKAGCGSTQPPPDAPANAVFSVPSGAVAGAPVSFDGTGSGGNAPLSCTWSFENADGSSVYDTRSGCQTTYTFQESGVQYVKLTVRDADGDTDSSKQSFEVASPSDPPPPDAPAHAVWSAPSEVITGAPVPLDGTASTGDAPISCTWSFENQDGSTVWETHSGCTLDFTFQIAGPKYVKLTVRDVDGDTDSSKQSFDAVAESTPPPPDAPAHAVWTPPTDVVAGTAVTLDGSASTGDAPIGCTWSFESEDGSSVYDTRSGCRIAYNFADAGEQYVKLTVSDVDGDTDSSKQSFEVSSPPSEPPSDAPAHAAWTPPTGVVAGTAVTLDGSASTGDAPVSCTWSFENADGSTIWETHPGCTLDFTFANPGTKYVKLTVSDADGDTDSSKQSFEVASPPPPPPRDNPAHAIWTPPSGVTVGMPVRLDGTASTGDAPISCTWSFENADASIVWETHPGCTLDFTFVNPGMKYVKLTVRDADGDTDSSKQSFEARSQNRANGSRGSRRFRVKLARAVLLSPRRVRVGSTVRLDASASIGMRPITCTWKFRNKARSAAFHKRRGCKIKVRFKRAGAKYIKLRVRAHDGSADSVRRVIRVRRRARHRHVKRTGHAHGKRATQLHHRRLPAS